MVTTCFRGSSNERRRGRRISRRSFRSLRKKFASAEKISKNSLRKSTPPSSAWISCTEEYRNRLGDYLNQPLNARRSFRRAAPERRWAKRAGNSRAASGRMGRIASRSAICFFMFSPATNCAGSTPIIARPSTCKQLKKALVNRDEAKRVETILEQFPARKISMKRLDDASRAIRRRTHEETLHGPAICRRLHAPAPRPPQLPARRRLDGAHQPGALGARARTFARK